MNKQSKRKNLVKSAIDAFTIIDSNTIDIVLSKQRDIDNFLNNYNEKYKNFATNKELKLMLYDKMFEKAQNLNNPNKKTIGKLISKEEYEEFKDYVFKCFETDLPVTYRVYYCLPIFCGKTLFEINEISFSLAVDGKSEIDQESFIHNVCFIDEKKAPKLDYGFNHKVIGLIESESSITFRQSLTALKLIVYLALKHKIIYKPKEPIYSSAIQSKNSKSIVAFVKRIDTARSGIEIELDKATSLFLNSLELNSNFLKSNEGNKNYKDFKLICSLVPNLLSVNYLLSAIDWLIESKISTEINKTISFLQICFGLEALFKTDSSNNQIEKSLAIKCSYLISQNIEERNNIYDNLVKIYKLRSNLVHGSVLFLNSDNLDLYSKANLYLERSIEKEIELTLKNVY